MLASRKLTTPHRSLFWVATMSLAMAYSGLTAMAESSSSSNKDSHKSTATSRSVSISENGKTTSISENGPSGITVTVTETVDGQPKKAVTQAANAAELAKKDPAAYDLYQRHLGAKGATASANAAASGDGTAGKGATTVAPGVDAKEMLRQQLREMREKNADNPEIVKLIDEVLRKVDEAK